MWAYNPRIWGHFYPTYRGYNPAYYPLIKGSNHALAPTKVRAFSADSMACMKKFDKEVVPWGDGIEDDDDDDDDSVMTIPFFIIKSLSCTKHKQKNTHKTQNTLALKTLLRILRKKKCLQSRPQGSPALEAMGKVPLLHNYLGKVYPVGNAYMGPTKKG